MKLRVLVATVAIAGGMFADAPNQRCPFGTV
jgi:hypothetical protein